MKFLKFSRYKGVCIDKVYPMNIDSECNPIETVWFVEENIIHNDDDRYAIPEDIINTINDMDLYDSDDINGEGRKLALKYFQQNIEKS